MYTGKKMLDAYFIKLNTCREGELIVKIADISMLKADGELCVIYLMDTNYGIKVKHHINEIEQMINITSYKVISVL